MKTANQLWLEYGRDLYPHLMRANFLRTTSIDERDRFTAKFVEVALTIPQDTLLNWLNAAWRERTVASWIISLLRPPSLQEHVSTIILNGADHVGCLCLAMARYGGKSSAKVIEQYLLQQMEQPKWELEQAWAVGALCWLDKKIKSTEGHRLAQDPQIRERVNEGAIESLESTVSLVNLALQYLDEVERDHL